jgi:uncharacterized membrane protein YgcG
MFPRHSTFLLSLIVAGGMVCGAGPGRAQMPGETDNVGPPSAPPDSVQNGSYPPQPAPAMNAGQDQNPDAAGDTAADGSPGVDFQTFYNSLSGEGTWIQTPQFGYVWQPNVNDPQWAPYTDGHWVYSDAGWTWVSNEPWGWATYHYGRWVNLDGTGWCWVPGYTWAPAWVSWRYGDGYVGWAPLPPDSLVGVDYDADDDSGFHIGGDCDSYYDIGAGWYCFLPILYIGEPDYRHFYVDRYHNYRLINHTTNVTNLNVTRGGTRGGSVFAGASLGGPSLREVDAASQTPVSQVNLAFTNRAGGGAVDGNSLALFAPRVQATRSHPAPEAFHSLGTTVINRGTDPSRPLMTASHFPGVTPTADQVRQAQAAQASAPVNARLATPGTSSPTFQPLPTMRPAATPAQASYQRTYSSPGYSASPGGTYQRPPSIYTAPRSYSSGGSSGYGGGTSSGSRTYSTGGGSYSGGGSSHAGGSGSGTNPNH